MASGNQQGAGFRECANFVGAQPKLFGEQNSIDHVSCLLFLAATDKSIQVRELGAYRQAAGRIRYDDRQALSVGWFYLYYASAIRPSQQLYRNLSQ